MPGRNELRPSRVGTLFQCHASQRHAPRAARVLRAPGRRVRGAIRGGGMRVVELCGNVFLLRVDTMNYLQKTKNAEAHLILMNLMRYNVS